MQTGGTLADIMSLDCVGLRVDNAHLGKTKGLGLKAVQHPKISLAWGDHNLMSLCTYSHEPDIILYIFGKHMI